MTDIDTLPLIDFGPFREGTDAGRREVPCAIREAAQSIGFLYLVNHGIPQAVTDAADRKSTRLNSSH